MSWSLQVSNGDLVLGSRGVNTVTGGAKVTQDLKCAVLEPMGTDELHPQFGSLIDGGIDPSGRTQDGVIGTLNDDFAATMVMAEIQRIVQAYQAQQGARNTADVATYGRSTLTSDEAVLSVTNISIQQIEDNMLVTCTLQTGLGSIPLTIPIS